MESEKQKSHHILKISDLKILSLLYQKPMTGYELKKRILTKFRSRISYGTLYPRLRSLEESHYITGKWYNSSPRKRVYTLTESGKLTATKNTDDLLRTLSKIKSIVESRSRYSRKIRENLQPSL